MMAMNEDPILTSETVGKKMEELQQSFKTFYSKPNPDKEPSKYGGYDDWLNDLKRKNYTQYEEYMKRYEEMEKRKEEAKAENGTDAGEENTTTTEGDNVGDVTGDASTSDKSSE